MKKLILSGFLLASLFASQTTFANSNFWQQHKGAYAPSSMEMIVQPSAYRILSLDNEAMKVFLMDVGSDMYSAKEINVPTPEGTFRTFKIWKNSLMAPELAAKYPEISTFDGYAVDNPNVTAKFGFNPFGFSAQVHDGGNTFYVDPYSNAQEGYYMAFYKRDLPFEEVKCANDVVFRSTGINDLDQPSHNFEFGQSNNQNPERIYSHSNQVRTFRTAITNTGEWATAIVGTINPAKYLVAAKIVEIVNRINGYFEREISVSLQLISNNDAVVFNNKDTDPYANNNNMEALLDEANQAIVNRIGANNFDLGHILCTAGGGLAQTPSVCSNGKGRGASTINSTTNLKTILHEMGHQMSASHTFSANTAGCNGNGMPDGAYESGSGVTIMSYSGACAENNVFPGINEDDYYHVYSLYQISNHINNRINCGTLSTNIPVLTIPNETSRFNVPRNTPFELVGATATVQGSQIPQTFLYNWEQFDNEFDVTEATAGNNTSGPSLRSHYPKSSTIQPYPPYDSIIKGNYSMVGYRLPNSARTLNFKYTARGILNNKGAFCFTDSTLKLNVVSGAGPFRVTSNASGTATWTPGETVTIQWNPANTQNAPINCQGVSIYLHFPDGSQPDIQIVGYAPNTGTFAYPVQNFFARNGYLKIKGAGNVFFDMSKGKINVNGTSVDNVTFTDNISVFPNPATDQFTIKNGNSNTKLNVTVYNITGKIVYQGTMTNELAINTSSYTRGNYIVQLTDEITKNTTSQKISIN